MGFIKSSVKLSLEIAVLFLIITFIPGLPPYVKISEIYKIKKVELDEQTLANNKLDSIELLHFNELHGPESLVDSNGHVFTSIHEGGIIKLVGKSIVHVAKFGKPCKGAHQEELCGRALGIRFGPDGFLYAADAYYGIFKVNVQTGEKKQLVDFNQKIEGKPVRFPNSVAVACNGDIYWTDSSSDFILQDITYALLADPSGRLIHYNAKTGKNRVLLDKIHIANGLILSQNEDFVLVSETARNQILCHYLKGPKKGSTEIFIGNLPGLPDNIQSDGQGGYLISLVIDAHSKNPNLIQVFSQFPNVRKFIARVLGLFETTFKTIDKVYPNEIAQKGVHFIGHSEPLTLLIGKQSAVYHVSPKGDVVDSLWSTNSSVGFFSEAHIVKDQLYLGSPYNKHLGRIHLNKIGWGHLKRSVDSLTEIKNKCGVNVKQEMPKPVSTTTKPVTTTSKPTTTTTSKPTTTTPRPTTTTTTTTPKPTTTTSKPTTPKPTTTAKKPSTATPTAAPSRTAKPNVKPSVEKVEKPPKKEL